MEPTDDPIDENYWADHYEKVFAEAFAALKRITPPGETSAIRALNRLRRSQELGLAGSGDCRTVLPSGKKAAFAAAFRGEPREFPAYLDIGGQDSAFLADFLDARPEIDLVVELGAGNGRNLIELAGLGLKTARPMIAAEQTESGRAMCRWLVGLEPSLPISAASFDFRAPDFAWLPDCKHPLFFTSWATMFVSAVGADAILALAAAAPRATVIHFETCGFQISVETEAAHTQAIEAYGKKWNRDLVPVLGLLAKAGQLDLTYVGQDLFPGSETAHTRSILIWQSPAGGA